MLNDAAPQYIFISLYLYDAEQEKLSFYAGKHSVFHDANLSSPKYFRPYHSIILRPKIQKHRPRVSVIGMGID